MTDVLEKVSRTTRLQAGKAARERTRRSSHSLVTARPKDFDVIDRIEHSCVDRLPDIVPIRYHRMATSAFAFFRGTANIMAMDLAGTPTSGILTQIGGDAHCANFGAFATPERNLLFDVRDFDETLRGPWEWDVKRLAASLVLAACELDLSVRSGERAVLAAVETYREKMADLAELSTLDTWYSRVDANEMLLRKSRRTYVDGSDRRTVQKAYEDMTEIVDGERRFVEESPLVFHTPQSDRIFDIEALFASYRECIGDDVRMLFDRYRLADWVIKVVGVGSVGTRCAAVLFLADENDPLVLQVKEAGPSVLESYLEPSPFDNHGQRVVAGQRIMQAASDLFLGWATAGGRDYYVRQLRDMKGVPDLEEMDAERLREFAEYCGLTLAGAHARGGSSAQISGYLGRGSVFDEAIAEFALAYADVVRGDFERLTSAIAEGRLPAREA